MAETNLNDFANGVASYLSSCIFPAISRGLAARGAAVSVEELLAMTNTPSVRATASPVMPGPAVPAMPFGGAVPGMAQAVAPTTRKSNAVATAVAGRTCMYQFKRGENKGKYCGKATTTGSDYCGACMKTRRNLSKEGAAGALPGAAPGMGSIPGMAGLPAGYAAPSPATAATANAAAQSGQLSVVPYDEARGYFREPTNNFIVREMSPGVIVALGRLDEASNRIVPLTGQEQATAESMGLVIEDRSVANAPAPVAAIPSVPAIPTISSVPAIPTAAVQPNPVGAGQPPLPIIPPLNSGNIPQVPNGAGVPGIPAIPQINM
jgi:hypothetical protein